MEGKKTGFVSARCFVLVWFFLALFLFLTTPATALAEVVASGEFYDNTAKWTVDSDGTLTIAPVSDATPGHVASWPFGFDYDIEEALEGTELTAESITALVIEEGISEIYSKSFAALPNLQGTLTIPASVEKIEAPDIFYTTGTTATTRKRDVAIERIVFAEGSKLTSLPGGTYNGIFMGMPELKEVVFPDSLTSVPDSCCHNCPKLETVVFPSKATAIGSYAFYGCGSLASVPQWPEGLKSIGMLAFSGNPTGPENNPATVPAAPLTSLPEWPSSLESFGNNAFRYCPITVIPDWPENLKTIGIGTFRNTQITSAPDFMQLGSLSAIGNFAFYDTPFYPNDETANTAEVPQGVTVGKQALPNVKALYPLIGKLPDGLKWSYDPESQTMTVSCDGDIFGDSLIDQINQLSGKFAKTTEKDTAGSLSDIKVLVLGDGITNIPERFSANSEDGNTSYGVELSNLEEIVIGKDVESISQQAFWHSTLKRVSVAEGVDSALNSIGQQAFEWCSNLESVDLGNTQITALGNSEGISRQFGYCANLETVILPKNLESIAPTVFRNCPKLKELRLPNTMKMLDDAFTGNYQDGSVIASTTLETVYAPATMERFSENGVQKNTRVYVHGSMNEQDLTAFQGVRNKLDEGNLVLEVHKMPDDPAQWDVTLDANGKGTIEFDCQDEYCGAHVHYDVIVETATKDDIYTDESDGVQGALETDVDVFRVYFKEKDSNGNDVTGVEEYFLDKPVNIKVPVDTSDLKDVDTFNLYKLPYLFDDDFDAKALPEVVSDSLALQDGVVPLTISTDLATGCAQSYVLSIDPVTLKFDMGGVAPLLRPRR